MNPIQIPKLFQSSVDPAQVSLTVTSLGKILIGIIGTIAITKGVDPMIVSQNASDVSQAAQNIAAQYVAVVPALYSAYHSVQFLWGFARKLSVWSLQVFSKAPAPVAPLA